MQFFASMGSALGQQRGPRAKFEYFPPGLIRSSRGDVNYSRKNVTGHRNRQNEHRERAKLADSAIAILVCRCVNRTQCMQRQSRFFNFLPEITSMIHWLCTLDFRVRSSAGGAFLGRVIRNQDLFFIPLLARENNPRALSIAARVNLITGISLDDEKIRAFAYGFNPIFERRFNDDTHRGQSFPSSAEVDY